MEVYVRSSWIVAGMVLGILSSPAVSAQEFAYDRLFPAIQQPWYFVNTRSIAIDRDDRVFVVDSFNHRLHRFTTDGQLTFRFGQEGTAPGQFLFPIAVATAPDGTIWVAETDTGDFRRIQRLDASGRPILAFGEFGDGPGRFGVGVPEDNGFSPFELEVDRDGNLRVGGSNRIQRFDPEGNFLDAIPAFDSGQDPFVLLTGFDVAADGRVYALDGGTSEVLVFSPEGQLERRFGEPGQEPGQIFIGNDLEIGPDGRLYVADGGKSAIIRFEPDGSEPFEFGSPGTGPGEFQFVWRLDFDSRGQIYTVDTAENDFGMHRVQKFTANGEFLQQWTAAAAVPGRFISPSGVAIDAEGRAYVADEGNDRVQVFGPDGAFLFAFGQRGTGPGQFQRPSNLAFGPGPDPRLYVVEFDGGRVQRFTADGTYDQAVVDGLVLPGAIAVDDDGAVFVTELGTDLVRRYDADLVLETQWGGHTECFDPVTGLEGGACAPGRFNEPRSLTLDRSGEDLEVVVGDYFNVRLQRFDRDGGLLAVTPIEFFPTAIAADGTGGVYLLPFSDSRSATGHFFARLDRAGNVLGTWGEFGSNPGQLNSPLGLALAPDGAIVLSDTLNHRVVRFADPGERPDRKAVLVAGGGPYPGNTLWPATQLNANFAYRALAQQGFDNDTIFFLSADGTLDLDGNGLADDVDGPADATTLEAAITDWAADADEVVLYLVDHGGDESFRLGETEVLSAAELAGWVDRLQDAIPGALTLVYDACRAGSFQNALARSDADRVVITSADGDESAFFVDGGALSFSSHFWTQVFNGASLGEAYGTARQITRASFPEQTPLLDADGDGRFDEPEDRDRIATRFLGNGAADAGGRPTIAGATVPISTSGGAPVEVVVDGVQDADGIARVWVVLRPPGGVIPADPDDPVAALPTIDLVQSAAATGRWRGTVTGLNQPGLYTLTVNAADALGNRAVPQVLTVDVADPLRRRAIVVDNRAVNAAKGIADGAAFVVEALRAQGYGDDDVTVLSGGSDPAVDGLPLRAAVEAALAAAATGDTRDLLLAIGGRKGSGGGFQLDDGELTATDLDELLDATQIALEGTLIVVYDGDDAGSFVPVLAPDGDGRVVIASAGVDQEALFEFDGDLSFGRAFWESVALGGTIGDAFARGVGILSGSLSPQVPQLEDNGNGIGNDGTDGAFGGTLRIGNGVVLAGDPPLIGSISERQVLDGTASGTVVVSDVTSTGRIASAVARIVPPGAFNGVLGNKPVFRALAPDGPNRFRLDYEAFTTRGEYQVSVFAFDEEGQLSAPASTRVEQRSGDLPEGFAINPGISGAWLDPAHNGEGWLIQVLDEETALVYWFTYRPDGEGRSAQVWIGAQAGRIEGPNIVIEEMLTTAGPRFGDAFDSSALTLTTWGDVTFNFSGCDSGRMYYRGRDGFGQGTLAMTRLTSLLDADCDQLARGKSDRRAAQPEAAAGPKGGVDARVSGAWFDPDRVGEGWLIEILPDDVALVVWFTYDEQGRQRWLIGTGSVSGTTITFDDLREPVGAFFGPAFDPDAVRRPFWGTLSFEFPACDRGSLSYAADDPVIGNGTRSIVPLTKIAGLGCGR